MFMSASLAQDDRLDGPSDESPTRGSHDAAGSWREAARRRNELARLVREHGAYLRGLARRLCRRQLDPDDLVQDVLEKLLRIPVPEGVHERAWLSRMTVNLFIDQLRRHRTRGEELSAALEVPLQVEARPWWENLGEADVRARVARLPEEQRATFELFAFHGKSYEVIAARLGISKSTVGTRILRARQKLRAMFVDEHQRT